MINSRRKKFSSFFEKFALLSEFIKRGTIFDKLI